MRTLTSLLTALLVLSGMNFAIAQNAPSPEPPEVRPAYFRLHSHAGLKLPNHRAIFFAGKGAARLDTTGLSIRLAPLESRRGPDATATLVFENPLAVNPRRVFRGKGKVLIEIGERTIRIPVRIRGHIRVNRHGMFLVGRYLGRISPSADSTSAASRPIVFRGGLRGVRVKAAPEAAASDGSGN